MINDTIINFYMLYSLSTYIDRQLQSLGIEPSDALTLLHTPMSELNKNEKIRQVMVQSVLDRFYIFNTSFYLQYCRNYAVWMSAETD